MLWSRREWWQLPASCAALALVFGIIVHGAAIGQNVNQSGQTGNPLTQDGNHMITGGAAPTLSSGCGVGATIAGTDFAGNVFTGTATAQPCTITFSTSYNLKPICALSAETATVSYTVANDGSNIALTSLIDNTRYRYHCIGRPRP